MRAWIPGSVKNITPEQGDKRIVGFLYSHGAFG